MEQEITPRLGQKADLYENIKHLVWEEPSYKGERPRGRPQRRWVDGIKRDVEKREWNSSQWRIKGYGGTE